MTEAASEAGEESPYGAAADVGATPVRKTPSVKRRLGCANVKALQRQ
jgi:hypothetical protein